MATFLEANNVGLQQRKVRDTVGAATIISCNPILLVTNPAGGACLVVQVWNLGTKIRVAELAFDDVGETSSLKVIMELIRLQGTGDLVDGLAMS